MPSLINVASEVGYYEQPTIARDKPIIRFEPRNIITVTVNNNPILAQFAVANPPGMQSDAYGWLPDDYPMQLAVYNWTAEDFGGFPIVGFRYKSLIAASPAVVSVIA